MVSLRDHWYLADNIDPSIVIPMIIGLVINGFIEIVATLVIICSKKKFIEHKETTEDMKTMIKKLKMTGPTVVSGEMVVARQRVHTVSDPYSAVNSTFTTDEWECRRLHQFCYKSWRNEIETGFEDVENMLNEDKTFFINLDLIIEPQNEETNRDLEYWTHGLSWTHKPVRIVTSCDLAEKYQPDEQKSYLQMPQFITPDQRILVNQIQFCNNAVLAYSPVIGPIYRLCIFICSKTVHITIKKTFNSVHQQHLGEDEQPFQNNIEDFFDKAIIAEANRILQKYFGEVY